MLRARNPAALKALVAATGITHRDLAAACSAPDGATPSREMVGRILRGERLCRPDLAQAITNALMASLAHGDLFIPEPSQGGRHAPRYKPPIRHAACGRVPHPPTPLPPPTGS